MITPTATSASSMPIKWLVCIFSGTIDHILSESLSLMLFPFQASRETGNPRRFYPIFNHLPRRCRIV
jgi:hypothetical protein